MSELTLIANPGVTTPNPEVILKPDVLRDLMAALRPQAIEFEREVRETLEIEGSMLEVTILVDIPSEFAGPVGKALRAIDVSWRLAGVITELDETHHLPPDGDLSLDALAPVEENGLVIERAEIASFHIKLKPTRATLMTVYTAANIAGIASSLTGVNYDTLTATVTHPTRPACEIVISGAISEPLQQVIQRDVPALPRPCHILVDVVDQTTGAHLKWTMDVPATT